MLCALYVLRSKTHSGEETIRCRSRLHVTLVCRYVADVCSQPREDVLANPPVFRTQMLHAYLPAIEVEITPGFAGTVANPVLLLHIHCLSDTTNIMVISHKGAICFAGTQLASMLGYSVKALMKMPMKSLMPQPYSLIHDGWMKVRMHRQR